MLDCAKGAIAVAAARAATDSTAVAAAGMVAVVAGHVYPAQLHFRGGRGLATALGAMAVLDWRVALVGWWRRRIATAATRAPTVGRAGGGGRQPRPAPSLLGAGRAVILGTLATARRHPGGSPQVNKRSLARYSPDQRQLQGYGLFETGCSAPVVNRS